MISVGELTVRPSAALIFRPIFYFEFIVIISLVSPCTDPPLVFLCANLTFAIWEILPSGFLCIPNYDDFLPWYIVDYV